MKKFLALLAVLALTVLSTAAFAEVTVSGSIEMRNLSQNNLLSGLPSNNAGNRTTQERIRLNVDAKHEGVKGRVTIENDWDVWGRLEVPQGNSTVASDAGRLKIREGWIDFTLPGLAPAHVKVGHQFAQLGNGWFFRSMKYGSDMWIVGLPGKNTVAFVDVKVSEGIAGASDDVDALVLLDIYKINDKNTVGAYFARVRDPQGKALAGNASTIGPDFASNLDNIGLHYAGQLGPVKLQAEVDIQMGTVAVPGGTDIDFEGNQVVLQASVPMDALTVNATIASGSGEDTDAKTVSQYVSFMDKDPHYTFIYEYFMRTAAGALNTAFSNTQAIGLGASYAISKNLTVALDAWMLTANEKVALNGGPTASDEVGTEVDAKILWKLYDNLTWNWQLGRFMPGKAYNTAADKTPEDIDAIQGVLSYKF